MMKVGDIDPERVERDVFLVLDAVDMGNDTWGVDKCESVLAVHVL